MSPATTAEPIEMPFGLGTSVSPTKRILDGPAHWRHTANTIESSMCSGDEILMSNDFDHLFVYVSANKPDWLTD